MADPLSRHIHAFQLSLEGLIKLLGGTPEERERALEILLGITHRTEYELLAHQIETATNLVTQVHETVKTMQKTAAHIKQETRRTTNVAVGARELAGAGR